MSENTLTTIYKYPCSSRPLASGARRLIFFKQKTAYDIGLGIPAEPLFRSHALGAEGMAANADLLEPYTVADDAKIADRKSVGEGKRGDLGGRRIIKKKRRVLQLIVVPGGIGPKHHGIQQRDRNHQLENCFFFKQKTAYEIGLGIPAEPLFRSELPWIGLMLAASFATYGLLRKTAPLG